MKARLTAIAFLVAGLALMASPATALHLDAINLDPTCTCFTLTVEGRTYENLQIGYRFNVTLDNGTTEVVSGTFPINYPGDLITGYGFDFRKSYSGNWPFTICGTASITGRVELQDLTGTIINWEGDLQYKEICPPVTVECPCCCPGTATPGYWKNHPDAWPVASLVIGGVTYTRDQIIAILLNNGRGGDKTYTLFRALVSAKLNVLEGCCGTCIACDIAAADNWLSRYPLGSNVRGNSAAWKAIEEIATKLDDYNNGLLGVPSRESIASKPAASCDVPTAGLTGVQCAPNPFNPNTTISFTLTSPGRVVMKVYTSIGTQVATITDRTFTAGSHTVDWNARNLASGIYFCRIQAGGKVSTAKLILMK